MKKYLLLSLLFIFTIPQLSQSQSIHNPTVDLEIVDKIMEEGIERSQVMEIASWLTDVYGPRLTNSPQMRNANEYTKRALEEMGLENSYLHRWGPFGKGWELNRFAMHANSPYSYFPVTAYPKAWSPGHNGPVEGDVVFLNVDSVEDLEQYRGTLSNKFVMLDEPQESEPSWDPIASRVSDERLLDLANAAPEVRTREQNQRQPNPEAAARAELQYEIMKLLWEEKPLAILDYGYRGWYGQIAVSAASVPAEPGTPWGERPRVWDADVTDVVPQISLMREHYGRIYRMLEKDVPVQIELDMQVSFYDDDLYGYNTIAEIPGTDPELKDEVVILGAHLDSWHASTGAADNASGSAVMMEAVRILKEIGVQPRRTIRIALWDGEEQGLHGSREYVADHFAEAGGSWNQSGEMEKKDDYDNFSAYYNIDNGTGQIRGIYLQQNEDVRYLFRTWLKPFEEWDANTVTYNNTGSTDHIAFDRVGLPGFQFIQDPIEYFTMTHHSNMDYYERLVEQDLQRTAVIVATFVYHTAMLDEKLPRK
ncbi:M20/M25/M40 family metallo-hydrolase [Rhodohalobacter halophilus]|uniref:M20/M25/M40 family metallo-hydrolase n=1 Tax=Rhodohalobacter halophilus TaxID=1812810 RepID=UPI00083FA864|nr:M20/M25/M40 family metallo-hydrolase [Rhodohalobacter halophilus]